MGVVLKRAHYFITCNGRRLYNTPIEEQFITRQLIDTNGKENWQLANQNKSYQQMSLADFGIG
ncbi:MAG: radical SAM protein, partial [Lachnospiraceae bacterium]|nr:radical SAM protein [Lachnospiraceae bacterium]